MCDSVTTLIAVEDTKHVGVNCINNGGGVGRIDGGERGESPGWIDNSKEHVCNVISNGGGVFIQLI